MRWRRRLFWKYVIFFTLLVTGALLASGFIEIYFSYQENKAALAALQREKAQGAAARIEGFITEIERQMGWVTQPRAAATTGLDQRRFDFFRLQRQVPPITEVSYLDAAGREQLRVSRLAMDAIGSQADLSGDPRFTETRARRLYRGPVVFRKESEPYMAIAIADGEKGGGGVTAADVNLKFIWDVVSQIRIGKAGLAFVVDGQGALIAHPDISLVLQKTDLARLDQVKAALAAPGGAGAPAQEVTVARNLRNQRVLTAQVAIPSLKWTVFVEQPLEEAFEPLEASMRRTVLLELVGITLAVLVSLVLARTMVKPIRALQAGAARFGEGKLGDRIEVRTGDELQGLADQFNTMAARLQESYAGLERKVEERTRELQEALEQQTATADVLRVISSSPTDLQPVLDAVAESAARLCEATDAQIFRVNGDELPRVARYGSLPDDRRGQALRITRGLVSGRAVLERRTIHVHDLASEIDDEYSEARPLQEATGTRTVVGTPLLREGVPIGAILIRRLEVRPFSDKQIKLLETFADQAVIAIENVRLFQELQARTQDLSQSLEETGALSEVIRAVSSSLDVREVLDTVARRAIALSGADGCGIFQISPGQKVFEVVVSQGLSREFVDSVLVMPVGTDHSTIRQATDTGQPVQIPDIEEARDYPFRNLFLREGLRSVLTVPMGGGDVARGIVLVRRSPGAFDERIVNLMTALANQSKVAIANAHLFREIEEKSHLLEVANQHKSEFLANMSHELRTPLNAIIGFSEVLLQRMFGELNPKQDEYLQDVLSSGQHLLSLINDILDLSKVEAGRMDLELARFHLPQALQDTLTLVRERAVRHGIDVSLEVDGRLGEFVADERKIKQVMLNLLSNAVKFTPEGGRIEVRAVPTDGAVEISVADTGIGIAPENQELIFEEFRQVGGDYAHKREGTGLGLTLARKLVGLHGGRIWVKSQPGQGSTFTFSIPERPWPVS
jgi:signal transduction histidine kinase/HAMP domain-containing protein